MQISVTGLGAVTSLGVGVTALNSALLAGRSGVCHHQGEALPLRAWAPLPKIDLATDGAQLGFRSGVLDALTRVGHRASSAMAATLLSAAEAWEMAACECPGERIGVIVAGSNLNQQEAASSFARVSQAQQVRPSYALQFMDTDYVGCVSELLGIRGEGFTVGGASGSGGVAIAQARRALMSGDVDVVVVVGVPVMLGPAEIGALSSVGALCQGLGEPPSKTCRPFDKQAAGFVYGQASATLILEPTDLVHKQGRQTLAYLAAATMALDANRSTNPSVSGEIRVMESALLQAQLSPANISIVSAHGTASTLGDSVEVNALRQVFTTAPIPPWVTAPKAILGHCLAAAGVVEAVVAILQLRGNYVQANPNLSDPIADDIPWAADCVAENQDVRAVLSNSFGFGGINSCQIFTNGEV